MTAKQIIKKLGGVRPAARMLNVQPSVVQQWGDRNSIPAKWFVPIIMLAEELEVAVTYKDLAMISKRKIARR